jgi:hypothetical protein
VFDVEEEGAAADLRAADEARPDAQVLRHGGGHVLARGEDRVDVALLQARVGERVVRRLHVERQGRLARQSPEFVRLGDAGDRDRAPKPLRIGDHLSPPAAGTSPG